MRATLPPTDLSRIALQIEHSYRIDDVRNARESWGEATVDLCEAVLDGASKFAQEFLEPLNYVMDREGCRIEGGRVRTPQEHGKAWRAYVEGGWPTLEMPQEFGGQGLPAILAFAAEEQFDRVCPAFGMMPVPQRSAFRVIDAFGDEPTKETWLPKLASGEWAATICVSEAGAGSDLRRLRTQATPAAGGSWAISGEKTWISFGDHDLSEQIGHIVLAQTADAEGKRRLSLFLVPLRLPDGSLNSIVPRRLEEKLGLHGSPTCELGFENATGFLLGEPGRGLAQLFVMIANMRLAVGAMGLGIASGSSAVAVRYAEERVQGGRPDPVAIAEHADVQLQLLDLIAPVELLRGLVFAAANCADLAKMGDDKAATMASWLLPIIKTAGGETAFNVSSGAIQVLGGAGYTAEWPIEQALRDARVLTIFEGTTGIQAQDLARRRLVEDEAAFDAFVAEASTLADTRLVQCLAVLRDAASFLRDNRALVDGAATAMLHLSADLAFSWIAADYLQSDVADPVLRVASEHWLDGAPARANYFRELMATGAKSAPRFAQIREALALVA